MTTRHVKWFKAMVHQPSLPRKNGIAGSECKPGDLGNMVIIFTSFSVGSDFDEIADALTAVS